jgi:hypothetical protein
VAVQRRGRAGVEHAHDSVLVQDQDPSGPGVHGHARRVLHSHAVQDGAAAAIEHAHAAERIAPHADAGHKDAPGPLVHG